MLGDYFSTKIFPPTIICVGLFGNFLALVIFLRKKLSKMSKLLRILIIFDSFGLLQILQQYMKNEFQIDVRTLSDLSCKLSVYFAYLVRPISAWLLVYICFERFLIIKHPSKYLFLKKSSTQISFAILVVLFNLAYYSIILVEIRILKTFKTDQYNNSTIILQCSSTAKQLIDLSLIMDMVNSVLVPFFLMILSTCLLISAIFQSRSKFKLKISTKQEKNKHKKDLQFAFSSISLNIIFLVLNLPISLYLYITIENQSETFFILDNIYYLNFGLAFLVHYFSNNIFREEFLIIVSTII